MQTKTGQSYLVKKIMEQQGCINIPAIGTSMYPNIKEGDSCRFVTCNLSYLSKGDIVLFESQEGKLVAHRFISRKQDDKGSFYLFKGDTNLRLDDVIRPSSIIGKLETIKKGNRIIESTSFLNKLWGRLVVSLPFLSRLLNIYIHRVLGK